MATHQAPEPSHPVAGKALFEVDTPDGPRPFIPPGPEPAPRPKDDEGHDLPDNPLNPRGKPSLSLPQQATPLMSEQGVMSAEQVNADQLDPKVQSEIMLQDGLAPDNPLNPRGTPDYIVAPGPDGGEGNEPANPRASDEAV